ncbi:MAG: PilZ domain-containing protein [Treponema sp.]|nr:PilZ domain-containing protein [Treponema sp.]
MFLLYGSGSGSPIEARQTHAPDIAIIIVLLIIFAAILGIAFVIYMRIANYYKSEKYLEKERNRKTKFKDVQKLAKEHNLSNADCSILWEVCRVTECNNVVFYIKSNSEVNELFREAYQIMKDKKLFTEQKMNDFFVCLFKLEKIVAQTKKVLSTRQIPPSAVIFYISNEGEQYPFTVIQNQKDFFTAEIPQFLYDERRRPALLTRSRFTFKTSDGLSYNLITRIIRYNEGNDGKYYMVLSHSEQLECQAQRNFKRDFFEKECHFSAVRVTDNPPKGVEKYQLSEKQYAGKLTNISAGGCCIQTDLPIKEKQFIGVKLPETGIEETIIGIIKKTRRLPTGKLALHIQFMQISLSAKNRIYTLVYKYEL